MPAAYGGGGSHPLAEQQGAHVEALEVGAARPAGLLREAALWLKRAQVDNNTLGSSWAPIYSVVQTLALFLLPDCCRQNFGAIYT